jgi:cell fate (sporulation/competence/biofilm development) regulator YlbF (YheA/YmcA/DUF963 family)
MQLTIEEQERQAYQAGDITLAAALAARIDAEDALAAAPAALEELQSEIEHLKRILADALADDTWRERAQAAMAD